MRPLKPETRSLKTISICTNLVQTKTRNPSKKRTKSEHYQSRLSESVLRSIFLCEHRFYYYPDNQLAKKCSGYKEKKI